jgi:hypothetical protein
VLLHHAASPSHPGLAETSDVSGRIFDGHDQEPSTSTGANDLSTSEIDPRQAFSPSQRIPWGLTCVKLTQHLEKYPNGSI